MFTYKGVKFIKTVYRPYCPLMSSLFFVGFSDEQRWREFIGFKYKLQDVIEIDGVYYYPQYHLDNFAKKAARHILKDKKNFLYLKKETLRRESLILKDINKKKIVNFADFFKNYLEYQPTLSLYHICDDFIEDVIRQELLKVTTESEAKALMSHINLPLDFNLDQIAKRRLLKTEDIDYFIKNHSWNFSRFGVRKFLTRQQAQAILRSLKKDQNFLDGGSRLDTKKAIIRAKKLLKNKSYYIDVMQFFIYYRTHRTDVMNQVFFSWFEALDSFAAGLGLSYDDLTYCLYNEILSRKIPSVKTLENRKKDFVAFLSHGQIGIVSGKQVNKFKKLCSEKNIGNSLASSIAFSGIIRGRVKIISKHKDLDNFKKGEVLVASMTTPSMVMAMKKASAFVTDEGGITCHAAILAREMKKPCVIGTKNATRLLKNGDFVEVDADKGIVRIIKK